jgi:hypothetical protein
MRLNILRPIFEMDIFKNQIEIIKKSNYSFLNPNEFEKKF